MNLSVIHLLLISMLTLPLISSTHAADATVPNSLQSGATAMAFEGNTNFSAVETAVNDNNSRISELESSVANLLGTIITLQNRIAEIEESQVMALEDYVSVDEESDSRGPLVRLSGANLQLVNGLGRTESINGLGNLIVGYDEVNGYISTPSYCSEGSYETKSACETAGYAWDTSFKTGSHYIVVGHGNSYSQYGGFVAGFSNFSLNEYSTVTGGFNNASAGAFSHVSCGYQNLARGEGSTVSGGSQNTASGLDSSVSGGNSNIASDEGASVSGGQNNEASGSFSSVSGGQENDAYSDHSSVSGGDNNNANGGQLVRWRLLR